MCASSCRPAAWAVVVLCTASLLAACAGTRPADRPPEERFGHRPDEEAGDERQLLTLTAPDSARAYFYYPTTFDTLVVRPASFEAERPAEVQQVPVEVLVKGALPDACSDLHDLQQERAGHIINITFTMRRPQGAVCASVVRPYRFYFMLEGAYGVGAYTLKVNGQVHPFVVRAPASSN